MKISGGYAYYALAAAPLRVLERWARFPEDRKKAILKAVEAGELTQREICREMRCSAEIVRAAMLLTEGRRAV